jgi:HJR/Mrr/RecB family endonuclease
MMPSGEFVSEAEREDEMRSGDYEFESAQQPYVLGELNAADDDCKDLVYAIEQGRWEECEELFEILVGRLDDTHIGDRATRRKFDPLCDEFYETLEFLQTVEFGALWIPADDSLLTAEEFQLVDRRLADDIAKQPDKLFSVDPRFFEDLMGSIYADLDYEIKMTKRTNDGGRDIIALTRRDSLSLKVLIECKRYARRKKVTVTQVRALFGVLEDEKATKALLATTSGFTKKAREFAKRNIWKLDLLDYDQLVRLIQRYATRAPIATTN